MTRSDPRSQMEPLNPELLRALLAEETRAPQDVQDTLRDIARRWPAARLWMDFLRLKDERQRALQFLRQERLWYQGFSWWMARMLMLFGLVMLIPAWFDRDLAERIIDLLMGAAVFYIWIWALAQWRYRRRRHREREITARYQQAVQELLQKISINS